MIIAALWAPMIQYFGGIWVYLQQMYTIFVPPIVVLFLVGVFYKKGNAYGAFMTLIIGTLLGLSLFILQQFDLWSIHFTINAGIVVAFSTLIFIFLSNLKPPPSDEIISQFTYNAKLINQDNDYSKWYNDYKVWAFVLLICIVTIFIILFKV